MKDMNTDYKKAKAFPSHEGIEDTTPGGDARNRVSGGGLNKREYFAAKAMQALIASGCIGGISVAMESVKYADALLAELEK